MDDIFAGVPECWDKILKNPIMYNMLAEIVAKLPQHNLSPQRHQIFNAFKYIKNMKDIVVMIIGQDPYIGPGEAHGLSFSVPAGIKVPPSLVNIYSALPGPVLNGNLEYWADQGVLLLNTALTTIIGKSNEHADLWKEYTDLLILYIIAENPNIAMMLWGGPAQKKKVFKKPETMVLEWRHPSPMSNNTAAEPQKFKNCDHFSRVNEWLMTTGRPPIDWKCGTVQRIIVFTDGAASANGSADCRAGWGVYVPAKPFCLPSGRQSQFIGHTTDVHLSGPVVACEYGPATNNRAEMGAILQGLLWLLENTKPPIFVTIVSDSQYSINTITEWGPKRIAEGSLHEKKNPELSKLIIDIVELMKTQGYMIDFHHMRGHGKDKNVCKRYIDANEIVDKLAVAGGKK